MNRAQEVHAKLEALRGWLEHSDLDAAVLSSHGGFAWITGGGDNHVSLENEAGVASVLVTREDAYLLAPNNELRRIVDEQAAGAGFTPVEWPWHEDDGEGRIVERLCDPARTVSDLGRLGLPVAPPDLAELRFTLLPPELDRYRRLGRDAAEAVEVAVLAARPGDRELDIAGRLEFECRRRDVLAVVALVGVDRRLGVFRHPLPTDRRLDRTLLVSLTGRRHGLHASLTRMVHHPRPGGADDDLEERHAAVVRVDARMIAESEVGGGLGAVFDRGVEQYQRDGFGGEWRLHHQGGLTGYAGREVFATSSSNHTLRAGQAVAWNPTIGGAKSEDTVLVGATGPETLTRTATWPQLAVEMPGEIVERPVLLQR